jgi:ribosomal protein S16
VDEIGYESPTNKRSESYHDRVRYWISTGVSFTNTVARLIAEQGGLS